MNKKYQYLAGVSFVLFMVAFGCFLIGLRNEAPMLIGVAFVVVSATLFIGFLGNRTLSRESLANQNIQTPADVGQPDPTEKVVSYVFGGVTLLFLSAGIWFMLYGELYLFA